ncbi:MAG: BatA and WFA domain-containing protein [Planctomycetota bacterium]
MFAFANPIFLWAILVGGAPILIHLIFRRKRITLKYPTLMFFHRVDMKLASRRKLKEILLLLLRALAIILVALAAARPVIRASGGASTGPADCVLIIDNSASMGLPTSTGTRLELARSRAASLIAALGIEDRVAVLTTVAGESDSEVASLAGDKERSQQALRSIYPTHGSGSLSGTLTHAKEIFAQSASSLNRQIYFFSDLHANQFQDRQALLKASAGWPERPVAFLCPVPAVAPQNNLSILNVSADLRPKVTGRLMTLTVKVKNNSSHDASAAITVTLGDAPPQIVTLSLPADAEQESPVMVMLGQEGFLIGEVKLGSDDATYDNVWPFCIEARGPLKALALSPSNPSQAQTGAAFYLVKALDPTGDGRLSGIRVDHVIQSKAPRDFSGYDIVVLCGCTALPNSALQALETHLQRGSGVIIFAGALDGALAANHPLQSFLGGRISGEFNVGGGEKALALQVVKPTAPCFDDCRTADGRVEFPQAAIFHGLHVQPHPETEVLAQFSNGRPAILMSKRGRGQTLWWTISAHADDSNLPLLPSFLALLHRSVVCLANAQTQSISQKAGVPLIIDLADRLAKNPGANCPSVVTVFDPTGKSFELPVSNGRIHCSQTGRAGVYRLEAKAAGKGVQVSNAVISPGFAITPDHDESSPQYLSASEAKDMFGFSNITVIEPDTNLRELIGETRHGRELFGHFIAFALLAILAEVMLANRTRISHREFSHRGHREQKLTTENLATEDTENKVKTKECL